ncbi:hypothetical protein Tco_0555986 [Tanacetum coccineum]
MITENFHNCICLKINHDGAFTKPPKIGYEGGKVNWINNIDSDAFSVNEPSNSDKFLDNDADELVQAKRNRNVHNLVITEHVANKGNAVSEDESESEYGSNSDDSDFIVDEENLIHDVDEVNEVFHVEKDIDFEDFDSGTDSLNEGVRKKAIRQLGKMNKVAVVKNSKKMHSFFLSKEVEETIKPNPKIPLSALKDQLPKKFELEVSKMKVYRAKQKATKKVYCHTTKISQRKACRRTHCNHTAKDNFLTCLQHLSSYTSGHLEVSESAACLEKLHFPALLVMSKFSRICFLIVILEVPLSEYFGFDMNYAMNFLCSI